MEGRDEELSEGSGRPRPPRGESPLLLWDLSVVETNPQARLGNEIFTLSENHSIT